jgi:hypothetical protein
MSFSADLGKTLTCEATEFPALSGTGYALSVPCNPSA